MAQKNSLLQETTAPLSLNQFLNHSHDVTDKLLLKALGKIRYGHLTVITPSGLCIRSEMHHEGPEAMVYIHNNRLLKRVFSRGDIGLGESFIDGDWDTPDLFAFLSLCVMNADHLESFADGHYVQQLIWRFINRFFRRNTKSGSRKNIMAHYDVGNDFYQRWLDPSMTYSSALFKSDNDTLEQAQHQKYQRILDELPDNTETILEIGCGWGGFAEYAAGQGKKVTSITISPAQYAYAKNRLGNKADILLMDYRDIQGQYDAIVSIEMFEAVGEQFWSGYFQRVKELLKPSGKAVIQSITVRDDLFSAYRLRNDFIRCYTFPGGMLPSAQKFTEIAQKQQLKTDTIFTFGQDYKKTLLMWLESLMAIKQDIIRDKGSEFLKSWQFYLALCAAGFACERINVAQFSLIK